MIIFYGFDPFFYPMGPHWPQDGPKGFPTVIWRHKRNFHFLQKIDDRGVVENSNFGAWSFLTVLTHFLDPMVPHWPQGGLYGVPTVIWRQNLNFQFFRKTDGNRKFEFWDMLIFYGFDTFVGPNGTPLAPRWTLGGPHRDLAP